MSESLEHQWQTIYREEKPMDTEAQSFLDTCLRVAFTILFYWAFYRLAWHWFASNWQEFATEKEPTALAFLGLTVAPMQVWLVASLAAWPLLHKFRRWIVTNTLAGARP